MDVYKLLYDQLNTAEKSHIEWNGLTRRTNSSKQESDLYASILTICMAHTMHTADVCSHILTHASLAFHYNLMNIWTQTYCVCLYTQTCTYMYVYTSVITCVCMYFFQSWFNKLGAIVHACIPSTHYSGGWSRKIMSSRPPWVTQ